MKPTDHDTHPGDDSVPPESQDTSHGVDDLPDPWDGAMLAGATLSELEGVRYLHLGSPWVQGAMRLRTPARIELEYAQRMMAWLLWRPLEHEGSGPPARHAVHLGLGAATLTRFGHQTMRLPMTTTVEINPTVIGACRLWFRLPDDNPRLSVVQADAGVWVADPAHHGLADWLCVDLYDHDAAAPVLDDVGFYRHCRSVLRDGGLMSVNLFGRHASFDRSAARIAQAFGIDQVWHLRATREGNTVVVAGRGVSVPTRDVLRARAATIEARYGLPARKWLRMVRPLQLDR